MDPTFSISSVRMVLKNTGDVFITHDDVYRSLKAIIKLKIQLCFQIFFEFQALDIDDIDEILNELDPNIFSSSSPQQKKNHTQTCSFRSTGIENNNCQSSDLSSKLDDIPSLNIITTNPDKVQHGTAMTTTNNLIQNTNTTWQKYDEEFNENMEQNETKVSPISQLISFSQMSRKWFESMNPKTPNSEDGQQNSKMTPSQYDDFSSTTYVPVPTMLNYDNNGDFNDCIGNQYSSDHQISNCHQFNSVSSDQKIDETSPLMLNYINYTNNTDAAACQNFSPAIYNLPNWNSPSGYDSGFDSSANSFHGNSPKSLSMSPSSAQSGPSSPSENDIMMTSYPRTCVSGGCSGEVAGKNSEGILTSLGTKELEMRMLQDYLINNHSAFKRGPRKNDPAMEKRRTHKCNYEG